jgi:hypothetical protein
VGLIGQQNLGPALMKGSHLVWEVAPRDRDALGIGQVGSNLWHLEQFCNSVLQGLKSWPQVSWWGLNP